MNKVSTPISLYTIEELGRRTLLIWVGVGMVVCHFIVAIVGVAVEKSTALSNVLITFICFFIFFFASTWGPTGWAVSGEVFPLSIRAKGTALSVASNWLWNFILTFINPYLVDQDKAHLGTKVFFIWGGTTSL